MDSQCNTCKHSIDRTTPVGKSAQEPKPGSVSVCFYCGVVSVFMSDLSLRRITKEELLEIKENAPESYDLIQMAVHQIQQRIKNN